MNQLWTIFPFDLHYYASSSGFVMQIQNLCYQSFYISSVCLQANPYRYTDTHMEDWPLLERSDLAEMPLVPIGWWTPVPSTIPASPGCFISSVRVLEGGRKTHIYTLYKSVLHTNWKVDKKHKYPHKGRQRGKRVLSGTWETLWHKKGSKESVREMWWKRVRKMIKDRKKELVDIIWKSIIKKYPNNLHVNL